MNHDLREPGEAILDMARELRDVANALGSPYLSAHVPAAGDELIVLTVQGGTVRLSARGFEVELLLEAD